MQIAGEFQRQTDDLTVAHADVLQRELGPAEQAPPRRLTIGGTLFVLYTVVTGFFGQNFGWLVDNIDSKRDFLLYGVGAITVPTVILLTLFWVKRHDWF